jgi:outer membrane protein OmpA-like peptidoglycan-associated protein
LDFTQEGAISAEPADYVAYLESSEALSKGLSGVPVYFYYTGDVADAQEDLTPGQRNNLIAIYDAVMTASGATPTFKNDAPSSAAASDNLPHVTPIDFPEDPTMRLVTPEPAKPTVIEFTNDEVRFIGDRPTFVDPDATYAILDPLITQMQNDASMTLHITGCTATAGNDKTFVLQLSQDRADAVKSYFISKGIDPLRITTEGAGDTLAQPDRYEDGSYIPAAAANNRKIIMEFTTVE